MALSVLERVDTPKFLSGVKSRGAEMLSCLRALDSEFGCFEEFRGFGLLLGAKLKGGVKASEVSSLSLSEGLVLITASDNTLRFAPALNIPSKDIRAGFARLNKALKRLIKR